jgi:hypothetical protein
MNRQIITDRRLLGLWRSDRESTVADWHFKKRLSPKKRQAFFDMFGHLEVTYTRTRIRGALHDHQFTNRYEVLATDSNSVAIRYQDTGIWNEWRIQHIHFEGPDRYWISLGCQREWFRQVKPSAAG